MTSIFGPRNMVWPKSKWFIGLWIAVLLILSSNLSISYLPDENNLTSVQKDNRGVIEADHNNEIELEEDSGIEITEVPDLKFPTFFEAENVNFDSEITHPAGTRAAEIENNNNPWNATIITGEPDDITGSCSMVDPDWFLKRLEVDIDNDPEYVQNLTLSVNSLNGESGKSLQISVYGAFDINQNSKIDWDTELLFMKAENFQIGSSFPPILWVNSYQTGFYFLLFRTDAPLATYDIRLTANHVWDETWGEQETDQNIDHAEQVTAIPTGGHVRIDYDLFDWYRISTYGTKKTDIGLNFSLKVELMDSLDMESELVDDKTVFFVTELNILVYHEGGKVSNNKPIFPFQYRDHLRLSRHSYTKLKSKIEYSDVITLPTHLFKHTYIGFYVNCYGIHNKKPDERLYPFLSNINILTNGWCKYNIDVADTKVIKRAELSKISVVSLTTDEIFGRTYDNYKYTVWYKQSNNNKPLVTDISIFTLEGEVREEMTKVTPGTVGTHVYEKGCKYEFTLSGLLLGEGNHHVFQFHFKDQNAWANGTIELGKSWHGPYISNNIRPYVRPTAPTNLTLYEDSETTYFDLNTIFEDSDVQEELNYTISNPKIDPVNRTWEKQFSNEILNIELINQTRLQIDVEPNMYGKVDLLFNVSDSKDYYLDSTYKFTIIVMPVNDPPVVIKYFTYIVLDEDSINSEINLYEHFDDPIQDPDYIDSELTFRAENNMNIDVAIDDNGVVTFTPKANWHGKEYIDFFASDGVDEASDFIKVIVRSINDVPVMKINETIEFWQDQWTNLTIDTFDAADNETALISQNLTELFPILETNPGSFGYSFNNETGHLTIRPKNSMVGTYSWNVSAKDINNAINSTIVTLIIHNVNDPPIPKILFPDHGARFLTTDKIAFRGSVFDPDKTLKGIETPPISITWYSTLHYVKEKIGSGLNLEPQLYRNGTHTITLSVNDGEYTRNTSIVVHVFAINKDLDTDSDGIPDYWENLFNLNIKDPRDADEDADTDTFSNWEEYKAETDPRDPNSFPSKHISRESSANDENLGIILGIFIVLIIIMGYLVINMVIKARRRKKEEEEAKAAAKSAAASVAGQGGKDSKFKTPKAICHTCGASFEVLTLNRPVVITCSQCGSKGAVYK